MADRYKRQGKPKTLDNYVNNMIERRRPQNLTDPRTVGATTYVQSDAAGTNKYRADYAFGTAAAVGAGVALLSNGLATLPIAHAGMMDRVECYVAAWTPAGATDTLTVTVTYGTIGATTTTTVTDDTGAECTFGDGLSIAVTAGQVLSVSAATSDDDTITGITVVITIVGA